MYRHPDREEYVLVVKLAAKESGLSPAIKRKLTLFAKRAKLVVYGADTYGGGVCPLRAVGVRRTRWNGPWEVMGGYKFQRAYDDLMVKLVGMNGPCAISLASPRRQDSDGA